MDAFCCTSDCKDQILKNRGSDKEWFYIIVSLFPLDAGVKVRLNKKIQIRVINLKLMIFLFCVGCYMFYQTTPLAETLTTLIT